MTDRLITARVDFRIITVVIPPKSNRKTPRPFDKEMYKAPDQRALFVSMDRVSRRSAAAPSSALPDLWAYRGGSILIYSHFRCRRCVDGVGRPDRAVAKPYR